MSTTSLPRAVRAEKASYTQGEEVPTGTYAGLTAGYVAVFGGAALALRLAGRRIPERIPAGDLALLGVGTYKLARLVSRDKVTSFLRMPVTEYVEPASAFEVDEKPRGAGVRRGTGELATCPWCVAQWVGTALGLGYVASPRLTRFVSSVCAAVVTADALHFAQSAVTERVEA
jgi:hypothetical protein